MRCAVNILYLCGSARSRDWTIRQWLDTNRCLVADFDRHSHVARMKSGYDVYFRTYDRPDRLRGVGFSVVFEDGDRITAPYQLAEETRELVRARLRQAAGPITLKTPPAFY